jgi:hypothetical protein
MSNTNNRGRGWAIASSLFQFFWKNNSRLLFSSSTISSSFLLCFELFKTWWVRQLRLHKTSLCSKCKDAAIKDFKIKILICFNSPIIYKVPSKYPKPKHLQVFYMSQRTIVFYRTIPYLKFGPQLLSASHMCLTPGTPFDVRHKWVFTL